MPTTAVDRWVRDPLLGRASCRPCRRRTCSPARGQRSRRRGRRRRRQQPALHSASSADLLLVGHGERVDLVGARPGARRRAPARRPARPARSTAAGDSLATSTACSATRAAASGVRSTPDGEAPGAVVHDAHREAEVLAVLGAVEARVAQARKLLAQSLDPEVGVLGAQLARRASAASASCRRGSAVKASSISAGTGRLRSVDPGLVGQRRSAGRVEGELAVGAARRRSSCARRASASG